MKIDYKDYDEITAQKQAEIDKKTKPDNLQVKRLLNHFLFFLDKTTTTILFDSNEFLIKTFLEIYDKNNLLELEQLFSIAVSKYREQLKKDIENEYKKSIGILIDQTRIDKIIEASENLIAHFLFCESTPLMDNQHLQKDRSRLMYEYKKAIRCKS